MADLGHGDRKPSPDPILEAPEHFPLFLQGITTGNAEVYLERPDPHLDALAAESG
jgi:hypothetical protein